MVSEGEVVRLRIEGPLTVLSVEGNVAIRNGPPWVQLHVMLAKQTGVAGLSANVTANAAQPRRCPASRACDSLDAVPNGDHRYVTDGRKNVPFALPDDEDEDVFSSVEMDRLQAPPPTFRTSGGMPAVTAADARAANVLRARLTVESARDAQPATVDVERDLFLIGGPSAHLHLRDDYVSAWHAQLRAEDRTLVLEDMGSENGVYLRIADELPLEDCDEIVVGNQRFVFRTSWDKPRDAPTGPFVTPVRSLGGNAPSAATRLVQLYSDGIIGGVWRIGDTLSIGRHNADVCEPDDAWLSDPHATIERRGAQFFIKDAHSQWGTFIRVFDPVELIDGDCFVVGRSRIKITYP